LLSFRSLEIALDFVDKILFYKNFMDFFQVIYRSVQQWADRLRQHLRRPAGRGAGQPSHLMLILKISIFCIVFNGISVARAGAYEDYWAAIRQDAPANVLRLILGGFDANTLDAEGNTGLTLALSESSLKVAEVFLALDAVDVNAVNKAGWDALSIAAVRGHEGALRRLMERKVQLPKSGLTPLHHAARGGHVQAMRVLLERGINVDALGPRGNTPLMLAAGFGNAQAVKLLLDAGAQPRLKNQLGHDALYLAQLHANADAARLLAPLAPRPEAVASLPPRRPSAATLTPALAVGPPTSASRPAARTVATAAAADSPASAAEAARQPSSPSLGGGLGTGVADWVTAPLRALRQALTPAAPAAAETVAAPGPGPAVLRSPQTDGGSRISVGPAAPPESGGSSTAVPAAALQRVAVTAPPAAAKEAPRRIIFVPPSMEPRSPELIGARPSESTGPRPAESSGPKSGW
jgi:hypothetical protein